MKFSRVVGLVAMLGIVAGLAGCGVNTIPTKEENARAKWSEVEVQYKRRADLIPQLVATVKGEAANERGILTDVINARASATKVSVDASTITDPEKFQKFQQAQDGLSSAIGRLMVIQEQYPTLKSNQGFETLMDQLEGTANRISIAQKDYNDAAQDYNTTLRTFPSIIWAKTMYSGSKPMQYFTAPAGSDVAPSVDFSDSAASK
ncbi:MAG: LemA family protein [Asticcacaulis sp.]|uniref:LemA family protein n=1 Tax=Asticcacaulis sp. TaxID=1872648 RepID=UPI003F7BF0BA